MLLWVPINFVKWDNRVLDINMGYTSGEFRGSEALLVTLAQDLAYHPSLPTQEIIRRAPLFFRIVFSWSVFVRVRVLIWACENSHFYFI